MPNNDDDVGTVERIITHRDVNGYREYLVAWENYPGQDSWIRRANFNGSRMVRTYEASLASRNEAPASASSAQRGRGSQNSVSGSRGPQRDSTMANNGDVGQSAHARLADGVANSPAQRGRGSQNPVSGSLGQQRDEGISCRNYLVWNPASVTVKVNESSLFIFIYFHNERHNI